MTPKILLAEDQMKRSIKNLIEAKPGAVGLAGERGSGKLYVAKYISEKILGSRPALDDNPNLTVLDAVSSGIEDVRNLQKTLSYSVPGKEDIRRIVIIEHFDNFGHEAQNALLKTLEEPPLNTMIIITIDNINKVLPTIISRVQILQIKPISRAAASKHLSQVPEAQMNRAYMMSGGSIGLLIGLLEQNSSHELVFAIVQAKELLQMPKYKRIAAIETLTKKPEIPIPQLLDGVVRVLEAAYKQSLQNSSTPENLRASHKRLQSAIQAVDDINNGLNQKLALTRLFLAL